MSDESTPTTTGPDDDAREATEHGDDRAREATDHGRDDAGEATDTDRDGAHEATGHGHDEPREAPGPDPRSGAEPQEAPASWEEQAHDVEHRADAVHERIEHTDARLAAEDRRNGR